MNRYQRRAQRSAERAAGIKGDGSEPLAPADPTPVTDAQVRAQALAANMPEAEIRRMMEVEGRLDYWINSVYQVCVAEGGANYDLCPEGWTHLNIRRRDGKPIFRDWRHFQAIKNQLCGPEREAVELYPRQSRMIDTSNKYHLWVAPLGYQFGFGWDCGVEVRSLKMAQEYPGMRQRA